jgi:septal ring factor EnvC (AmiA/AmiB activator)
MRYLREYAHWQKRQANSIVTKQKEITAKQKELQQVRNEKQLLLTDREQENQKLTVEEANQKRELQQLNRRKQELQAELKKKEQQAEALDLRIEKLITEEMAKTKTKPETARRQASDRKLPDDFEANRGRLPFPLAGKYTIAGTFGRQQHQELKYVHTNNSGIDIQTTPGTDARAVFTGEVTRIFVVPGYNNSIILRHGNYLTVYSNLSQVYVKTGDKVETRQALGKIFSDSGNGNTTILHFQIRKEKTKLDPLVWLAN